jgi:hypothetical protein
VQPGRRLARQEVARQDRAVAGATLGREGSRTEGPMDLLETARRNAAAVDAAIAALSRRVERMGALLVQIDGEGPCEELAVERVPARARRSPAPRHGPSARLVRDVR